MAHLGLFFVLMVMFMPGGIASLLLKEVPLITAHKLGRMLPSYSVALGAGLVLLTALILTVELIYKLQIDSDTGTGMTLAGFGFDVSSLKPWAVAAALWMAGALGWRAAVARVHRAWEEVQTEMTGGGV
jgi:branched-chain amino acid transport system permease protein